eukprot:316199-Amphidinium_carterae.1
MDHNCRVYDARQLGPVKPAPVPPEMPWQNCTPCSLWHFSTCKLQSSLLKVHCQQAHEPHDD